MKALNLVNSLNETQKAAAKSPRRPVLMLAGPGTGKTRTLIARISYEIENHHIPPENILALTFSNKAAAEIRQRLQQAIADKAGKVRCSTFHSFCLDVLRKNAVAADLSIRFGVCDDAYQSRLLKKLLLSRTRENIDKKVRGIQLSFSNYLLKNKPLPPFAAIIFEEYNRHLDRHKLIDYDQILVKTLQLFLNNHDILSQYRFLNQSILVDEFQDTDPIQYQIVKLLAQEHQNIFVVADDDQSIYAWRGANPENIRQFMNDFHISKPIFLEYNYRCGPEIMRAAQNVVKDTDRVEPNKVVRSDEQRSARIQALFFQNESQEITFIIDKLRHWYHEEKVDYKDIAVIYPQHRYGTQLASYLLRQRLPYQQATGRNLTEHPVMQKIILYLQLIRDPSDNLVLEELAEKELEYHTLKQLQDFQRIHNSSFRKALNDLSQRQEISYKVRNQLSTFIGNIANLVNLRAFYSFKQLIREIIRGINDMSPTPLQHNAKRLSDVSFQSWQHLAKPLVGIWVYHENPQISFVARAMLLKAFGNRVHVLDHDKLMHINSQDIILLLSPFPTDNLPVRYEALFSHHTDRRKGALSTLFRWLQVQLRGDSAEMFKNYVVFDLETTGKDPATCGIVEIAAIRIEDGEVVDEFQKLVNPGMEIEPEAQAVHNISQDQVKDQPGISDIWPQFAEFVGSDLLIAHNGYAFDFKIIDRVARELGIPKLPNVRYDSLILARTLYPNQQNSIDGLMARYKLDADTRHRALDDVKVLNNIFRRMLEAIDRRNSRSSAEEFTEYVALGNIIENRVIAVEDKILFMAGLSKLRSPYSNIRNEYLKAFQLGAEELEATLMRHAERLMPNHAEYDTDEDFFRRIMEVADEFNHLPADQAIAEFLSFLALINPQDALDDIDAISLLTFHAAKGLEFDRVIIMGLEDEQMPSYFAYQSNSDDDRPVSQKLEEQKRLLYVGITRSKSQVIFTSVKNRFGRSQKSSPFLEEIKDSIEITSHS